MATNDEIKIAKNIWRGPIYDILYPCFRMIKDLKNVKESIAEFVGDTPQFDDITMLAFRYNGK